MKNVISILFVLCLLLTACAPPVSSDNTRTVSAQPQFQAIENQDYTPFRNPYNMHVVGNQTFVYFYRAREGHNGVFRVTRTGTEQRMIINSDGNVLNLPAARSIIEHDGWLYTISSHDHEAPKTQVHRLKEDVTGTTVITIDGTWSIGMYDQYLVLRNEALPYNTGIATIPFEEQYRVYIFSDGPTELEEVDPNILSDESTKNIKELFSHINAEAVLAEQLLGDSAAPGFHALQANDAYYHVEMNEEDILFGRTTPDYSQTEDIPLSEQARQTLKRIDGTSMHFLNYDAEWIYFAGGDVLYRLKKDGERTETLIDDNADLKYGIDIVDNMIFFAGQDGADYYEIIGDPSSRRQLVFDPMGEFRY